MYFYSIAVHQLMPVGQILRGIIPWLDLLAYLAGYFEALVYSSAGELRIILMA
jgi:hypothetical protein